MIGRMPHSGMQRTLQRPLVEQVVPATAEPVTLEKAKAHCGDDAVFFVGSPTTGGVSDALIETWISAAREDAEAFTGLRFTDATYELRLRAFEQRIQLPPWAEHVVAVSYLDVDGVATELGAGGFEMDVDALDRSLVPANGAVWPETMDAAGAVRVRLQGRYSASGSPTEPVPARVEAAILLLVGHLYENRGERPVGMPPAVEYLLRPLRISTGMA